MRCARIIFTIFTGLGTEILISGEGPRYRWSVITLVCMCVGLVGGFLVYGGMLEILPYSFMLLIDSCTTDCTMYGIVHEIMVRLPVFATLGVAHGYRS